MMFTKRIFSRSILLLICLLLLSSSGAYTQESLEGMILERVARDQGVALNSLEIGALDPITFSLTGITLYKAKVIDKETGDIFAVVVDEGGIDQSIENASRAERDDHDALYGNLDPALYDLLQDMADDETVTVAIWLRTDDLVSLERLDIDYQAATIEDYEAEIHQPESPHPKTIGPIEESADRIDRAALTDRVEAIRAYQAEQRAVIEAYQRANVEYLADLVVELQAPILADLSAQGYEPVYVSPIAPLIYVELPKSTVFSTAQREDVDTVYGPNENYDLMNSAKSTQKADIVDSWGFDGSGIDVAILEDSRIQFSNPYLNTGTTRIPADPNVDDHATGTAGMVASQHGTYQGISQGVNLFSANATTYGDADLAAAMDWAASTQNVDIINNSWGGNEGTTTLNVHDRHLDYIVRNLWSTVTVAAGNEADGCGSGNNRVTSPARGYNVISVGNYVDNNTLTWSGDVMDACSSYINPSTGVEKPEVAAVGSSIWSTTASSPWTGNVGSGTSYAAPMVAGEAALLMERNSMLLIRPEAVKAIIMATALNNIEGGSRLSEKDGAGGVDMRAAFHTTDEQWWAWTPAVSGDFPISYSMYVAAGDTVRAAIAWDSNPNSSYTTDPLQADIDLTVYDPDGVWVTASASIPYSYEIVEFTPSKTGLYEFHISAFSFSGSTEYLGFAFWQPQHVLTAYNTQTWGTPPVSQHYYRFASGSFWNAVGIRSPSGGDYDVHLYSDSAFSNPDDHDWLEDSTLSSTAVDYVVVDRNHAPSGDYYPEVAQWSGSGNYDIEWATRTSDTGDADGTYGPFNMTPSQVIRVWDSWLSNGVRKYFAVKPISGNADLGMALHDSLSGTFLYQGRSNRVVDADSVGAGGDEFMDFQASADDWMGLVVWNNGASTTTTFYLYTDTTAPTGSISINAGATYATSTSVTLNLSGSDAETGVAEMRFLNAGFTWSAWEPFAATKSWTLPSGDGDKTVYAQFRNNAGMVSSSYGDSITLDTVAPTGSIVINSGDPYALSTSVTLSLSANDIMSGVAEMQIGNFGGAWEPWEAYATSRSWNLLPSDGGKSVWVKFKDQAGNISIQYGDSIVLDTLPPTGSILIDGGDTYTNSTSVSLTLSAADAGSGVDDMRFQNQGSSWSAWEPFAASKSWTLLTGDGTKTVNVQFRDHVGRISTSYNDSIILDTTPPSGSILISAGAAYANSTSVTLNLLASDSPSGVAQMRISNNGSTWSSWESYATSKSWMLAPGDGTKSVYVQYRDHAGNDSISYSDSIVLDTVAPTSSATSPTTTLSLSFTVSWSGSDGLSGVESYDVQYRLGAGGSWTDWLIGTSSTSESFGPTSPVSLVRGETYYFRVRAHDSAGNVESYPASPDTSTYVEDVEELFLPVIMR